MNRNAELLQQAEGNGAGSDAGCRLAGAGPLQYVADVVKAVFHSAGEVGVAGAQPGDALTAGTLRLALDGAHRHGLLPVGPVAVFDCHADGAAQRLSVSHAEMM